jgi:HrpA-like RNA helicase
MQSRRVRKLTAIARRCTPSIVFARSKSTQVPQFLLDDPEIGPTCNILITQPRRISAISVAERVASERCESPGESVGFSVRLEGRSSKMTQLLFCTPGVLMRRLNPDHRDWDGDCDEDCDDVPDGIGGPAGINRLSEYTHIIMDEIHERDKNTEFLMIALQDLLEARENLKLILMSATMPTRDLAEYWCRVGRRRRSRLMSGGGDPGPNKDTDESGANRPSSTRDGDHGNWGDDGAAMPVEINIPGRTFPVQEFFLEDVLSMTGFVSKAHPEAPDMAQIESDLLSLLGGAPQSNSSLGKKNGVANGSATQPMPWAEGTLSCVMCGQSGFRCAEELGTHIALCDGGGGVSMLELEDRVRSVDATLIGAFDASSAKIATSCSVPGGEEFVYGSADDDKGFLDDIIENDLDYYDDEEEGCGLIGGKWDGQSPFGNDAAAPRNKPTLTEDELLTRYQTMYDDEEINYDLTLALVRYVNQSSYGDGAILIFFSGWADISEFLMMLESTPPFNDRSQFVLYPLHSGIPSKEQRQVFVKPPRGVRKIILATNIAETSLTIEDVAFVIDTGRSKEKSYDPHLKTSTLQESWISQASAKQRKGRAGRCKAGVCFHLFSKRRHASMRPFVESELVRTPLEEICLQCKQLKLAPGGPDDPDGIPAFLSKAMTPPHSKSVMNALELLCALGAMDEETNELTNLGICLSALSLEPRVGKMAIMSYMIGCAEASSSMAVAMSYKSPFTIPPPSMRKVSDMARVKLSERSNSDQITSLNVLRTRDIVAKRGSGALAGWCRQNYLNFSSLNMISELRNVVSRELEGLGFPPCSRNGYHNRNGDFNPAFLQASICAGLYPNVAYRRTGDVNFSTLTNRKAKLHLGSVNAVKSQPLSSKCQVAENQVEFVVFGEMIKGKAMFTMENTTHLVSPLPLLLLCGQLHVKQIRLASAGSKSTDLTTAPTIEKSILSLDDWLVFLCEPEVASALVVLRQRLDSAFSMITSDPKKITDLPPAEKDAVETLSLVLNSSHNAAPKL